MEIDNALFLVALPERNRTGVEDVGRVELNETLATELSRTKLVHASLLMFALVGGIYLAAVGVGGAGNMMLAYPTFWLAGALEAVHREPTTKLKAFKIAKQSVAVLLGGGVAFLSMGLLN